MVIITMIIHRREIEKLRGAKKWSLVFGRRKTGKTFLVENFLDYDEYFFVKRDRTIISKKDGKEITYDTFKSLIERLLPDGKTIVVDEFHRLGEPFLDFLQYTKKAGMLFLLSSTLFLSKKMFSPHSAVLGLFSEFPIRLISLEDTLRALRKFNLEKKELVEAAILLREPIAIEYFDGTKKPREMIAEVIMRSCMAIPALVGEVFLEEERSISAAYEGVLRAIASGKVSSGEIANYLFSRKLIEKNNPSMIQQYLKNLVQFGILKKLRVYGRDKFNYRHASPLSQIFYYADEKYNISERTPSEKEIERLVSELMPRIVEDSIRELAAEKFGLEESIIEGADYEVDACLLRFKKPEIALEIKWKESIKESEIERAAQTLEKTGAARKILFVPDKKKVKTKKIEVMDISDFM